jgi:hypothetical protein
MLSNIIKPYVKKIHISTFFVKIVKGAIKCKMGQTWGVKIARWKLWAKIAQLRNMGLKLQFSLVSFIK